MAKRVFDIIFSVLGLVLLSPILAVISILIKKEARGPVLYRGIRIGLNGKTFKIFKFRTMVVDADKTGGTSTPENDPRITRIGHALRRYKLDEIPQLVNILKGEMSFVGPRPQVPWAVELYSEDEKLLLSVRPGITDYASIKFKNEAEILKGSTNPDRDYLEKIAPEKVRLGLEYVRKHNVWIDMKIMFRTIKALMIN